MSNPFVFLAAKGSGHGHSATAVCGAWCTTLTGAMEPVLRCSGLCPGLVIKPCGFAANVLLHFCVKKAHVWLF